MFSANFLQNLSRALLQICEDRHFSYERAAEHCDLSSRYFGSIVRVKTSPTILTLQKLCEGLRRTPDELLLSPETRRELSFRLPMPVTHIRCFHYPFGLTGFAVCPRCKITMEREGQHYCDRCGQCLDWDGFSKASFILPEE